MSNNNNIDNYLPKKIEEPSDISKRIQLTTELNKENNSFEQILSKPLVVLYDENKKLMEDNTAWQKAYEKQQNILANWMLGEGVMRHLAIKFGEELGFSKKEVYEKYNEHKEKFLNKENQKEQVRLIDSAIDCINQADQKFLKDKVEQSKNNIKNL